MKIKILSIVAVASLLGACGGEDGDGGSATPAAATPAAATPNSGTFIDSPVQGLGYSTSTLSGKTDSSGTFQYANGETVTFKVGDVVLGSAAGAATVTPVTLGGPGATSSDPKVLNIASFIQTLDKNGGSGSNIEIPDAAHAALSISNSSNSAYVQLLNTTDGFVKDSQTYSTAINNVLSSTVTPYNPSATVVDTATAKQRMESYLDSKNISYTKALKVEPLTANLGISTTFTVTGADLPTRSTWFVTECYDSIGDSFGRMRGSSTSMTFTCTPRTVGIKAGEIQGTVLKTFNVNVTVLSGRFVNNGNGTVTDTTSGLILLQNPGCFSSMKWQNAMDAAAMLANGKCGLTDGSSVGQWRLPSNPSEGSFNGELEVLYYAKYDTTFTGVQIDTYWSRTTSSKFSTYAWTGNLFNGDVRWHGKADIDNYVWPVRGAQ